jgi:hypothetical protein
MQRPNAFGLDPMQGHEVYDTDPMDPHSAQNAYRNAGLKLPPGETFSEVWGTKGVSDLVQRKLIHGQQKVAGNGFASGVLNQMGEYLRRGTCCRAKPTSG